MIATDDRQGAAVSETSQGEGWWLASDGKWYPPEAASGNPEIAPPRKRPWWKRWWVIVIAALLVLGVVATAASGPDEQSDLAGSASTTTEPTEVTSSTAEATTTARPTTTAPTTTKPSPSQPADQTLSGRGQTATTGFGVEGGLTVFRMKHQGSSNFQVELLNEGGDTVEYLANVIGRYDGATAAGIDRGRYTLQINADGPWSVTVQQPRVASGAPRPQTYTGSGPNVVGPFQGGGNTRFAMRHQGDGNFQVTLLDAKGKPVDYLANEIGAYSGSESGRTDDEPYFLNVEANGPWSIEVSKP